MNFNTLIAQRPDSVAKGYSDAIRYLGCQPYVCMPQTKMEIRQLIEKYGVRLILTESKYGIRQLPVDIINKNDVMVVSRALPLNSNNKALGNPYEIADQYETEMLSSINRHVVWTPILEKHWDDLMHGWLDADINLVYLPHAGNLFQPLSDNFRCTIDVAIASSTIQESISDMLIRHLNMLGKTYGDCEYGQAKVCFSSQIENTIVNQSVFAVPIMGGTQIVFAPESIDDYFEDHVDVVSSPTALMPLVERYVNDSSFRFECIKKNSLWMAMNHSYMNRLHELLNYLAMPELAEKAMDAASRLGHKRSWEINARLNAEERGEIYEPESIAKIV